MALKLPGSIPADGKLEVQLPETVEPGAVVVTIERSAKVRSSKIWRR